MIKPDYVELNDYVLEFFDLLNSRTSEQIHKNLIAVELPEEVAQQFFDARKLIVGKFTDAYIS